MSQQTLSRYLLCLEKKQQISEYLAYKKEKRRQQIT